MANLCSFRNIPYDSHQSWPLNETTEFIKYKNEVSPEPTDKFEKILKLQDKCIQQTASEIRTPLARLQLHISNTLKAQENGKITTNELHHRLLKAESQCDYLTKIIDELIELSGEHADTQLRIQLHETNVCNIAADVTEKFLDEAVQKKCRLSLVCPQPVVGLLDPKRVDQLLTHLVSNAIKFAPGTAIKVKITSYENMAILEVSDKGPGIPFSKQDMIFDRFSKLNESSKGFGLGLWLVKGIVDRLNGTIRIASWPGEGSTFTIELPLRNLLH